MTRNWPDVLGGVLLLALAGCAAFFLARLPIGTAARPDAAFLPLGAAMLLGLLGVLVLVQGISGAPDGVERGELRPALAVLGSVAVFALLLESAGLPIAIVASVMTASLARPGMFDWRALVFAVALAAACTVAFRYGLNLPFRLVP